jgi:hypothetical protein
MAYAYYQCYNLTGSPVCGDNVTSMAETYNGCQKLTGSPVCGDKVTNFSFAYRSCYNLTGSPVCGSSVTDMIHAYYCCNNLTGSPACGPNVTSMGETYYGCSKLTGSPVCGPNVLYMSGTYINCNNLTGSPVCGPNVIEMGMAYRNCYNLTGSPVCGNNVINMYNTYCHCSNLTGDAACGDKVVNMSQAYRNCINLTGNAACGPNVTNMYATYLGCTNLTAAYIGPKVTNSYYAYGNCSNIREIVFDNTQNLKLSTNTFTNLEQPIEVDFPGTITSIGSTAFYNCRNIKSYSFDEHIFNLPTLGSNAFGPISYGFNIYIQATAYDSWSSDSVWESYRNAIVPRTDVKKVMGPDKNECLVEFGYSDEITLMCVNFSDEELENMSISTGIESEGKVTTTYRTEKVNDYITYLTIIFEDCGVEAEILHNMDIKIGDHTFTKSVAIEIVEEVPFSYEIVELDDSTYTFKLNSNGYYESNNKGVNSSYAMCKLVINNRRGLNVHLECINYAESTYDYGIISKRDKELSYNNSVDSSDLLLFNFKSYNSNSVRIIELEPVSGTYYIKYRKDSSQHHNNDSLQFKVVVS